MSKFINDVTPDYWRSTGGRHYTIELPTSAISVCIAGLRRTTTGEWTIMHGDDSYTLHHSITNEQVQEVMLSHLRTALAKVCSLVG